ncbi:MarR family winged helix-turn-helix transcriptional regulator [Dongia mobilis]|jgi:DNA-binding MarR family transcriptional regulator|uniref:MarR family winged helix-turn-helix transcriptional regulator n=1 Tax=Dongia sp. TaxID=1977262 RepID=UPI0026F0536A
MGRSENSNTAEDLLQLSQQLCFALYAATHAFNRAYKPLLAPLELTYPQYLVMLVLWEADDLTVKEIGSRLQLDSGTLTPLLKRLETARLVERVRDSADERQVRVHLTESGRALRKKAEGIPKKLAQAIGRPIPDIVALRQQLTDLRARMDAVAG